MTTIKPKKCATCGELFTPYKPLDKYCRGKCASEATKSANRKFTPIKPLSKKRQSQSRIYSKLRAEFLSDPKNLYCSVSRDLWGVVRRSTEIHHIAGRVGERLNDTTRWLAISREAHTWIHNNPTEAIERGWLIKSTI